MRDISDINDITGRIVDCAYQVHRGLGPGLLEHVYEAVLAKVLEERGFTIRRQVPVPIHFAGLQFDEGFRADILVDERVLLELKSVEKPAPVHKKQLLTYLKLLDLRIGLLINFGAPTLKEGVQRVINSAPPIPRQARMAAPAP